MAVTSTGITKENENLGVQSARSKQYPTTGYQGLAGVTENTAQQNANYQRGYQQGQNAANAQNAMQNIQNQRPQGYNSKYGEQLDSILQQIQNPEKFRYEFNGDNLFRSYADYYTQKGKQASLDAQGQAAGLTGGYGNSYGQNVGTQAYQQYLLGLYDKGLDMYDRAYQRYRDEQEGLQDQYGLLQNADQTDYGRYRDTYGDWENQLKYYTDRYDTEADRDRRNWENERDYWMSVAQGENSNYRTDQQYAYNYVMQMIEKGQMPSAELLAAAGLSEEDAQKLLGIGAGVASNVSVNVTPVMSGVSPYDYYRDDSGAADTGSTATPKLTYAAKQEAKKNNNKAKQITLKDNSKLGVKNMTR